MNSRWIVFSGVVAAAALGIFVAATHQSPDAEADPSAALSGPQADPSLHDVGNAATDNAAGESVTSESPMASIPESAASFDSKDRTSAPPPPAGHFHGRGESSLLGPEGSINSQSAEALLSSENFEEFAAALARESDGATSAIANEHDYREGLATAMSGLDGAKVGTVGCGTTLCVVEISAAVAADDMHDRVVDAFGERGLPGNVLIPHVVPGQGGLTRVRLVVGFGPEMQGIYIPPGSIPAGN